MSYAQYRKPRFSPFKKYLLAEIIFFISIQLTNISGDLQVEVLFENYFYLGNPFFVMYTDIPEFHLISPTTLMMNDLHLSSYMT